MDDPAAHLLCFPAAGCGPQVFRRWARLLPGHIGLSVVELPGHGARLSEPPLKSVAEVVGGPLAAEVRRLLTRPLVFFGHSMGALVALELSRALGQADGWCPALFVAAACAEPGAEHVPPGASGMSDAAVVDFLRMSGGTSENILAVQEYRDLLVPVVRADLGMVAGHRFADGPSLKCPVRVYVGAADPTMTMAEGAGWAAQSSGDSVVRVFDGGHFFFQEDEQAVIARLREDIDDAVFGRRVTSREGA
nr:Thioesterase in siderophore biosynthesis gene cluster [Kibdelosporangium sp. MJ126-NF4]